MTGATTLVEMVEWAFGTARTQLAALGIGAPHAPTLGSVFERLDAQFLETAGRCLGACGNGSVGGRPRWPGNVGSDERTRFTRVVSEK